MDTCDGVARAFGEIGVEHGVASCSHELLEVFEPCGVELADDFPAAGLPCWVES